jgi:transposase
MVSDGLWARIEPLFSVPPWHTGHPLVAGFWTTGRCCAGSFALYTGISWESCRRSLSPGQV